MERIELARFAGEVGQRFEFLVGSYGMEGPESSDLLLPSVFYRRPELLVAVFLDQNRDHPGRRIGVSVSLGCCAHIPRRAAWLGGGGGVRPRTSCRLEGPHSRSRAAHPG